MPPTPATVGFGAEAHIAKRFVFYCDGTLQEWASAWYTMPFYLDGSSSINSAGQNGNPVAPPPPVVVSVCPNLNTDVPPTPVTTSVQATTSASATTPAITSSSAVLSRTTGAVSPSTAASLPLSTLSTGPTRPATATAAASASGGVVITSTVSHSASNNYSTIYGNPTTSTASATAVAGALRNADAGHWDATSKAVALTSVLVLAAAVACVALWAAVRKRFPAVYSPRTWFLSPSRLPAVTKFAFAPFLALPPLESPTSDAHLVTHVLSSTLGVAAIATVLGLAISLPLSVAGVPHLSSTAPPNLHGGRLSSLMDLSLIRLLDALRPSPAAGSPSASLAARGLARLARALGPALVQRDTSGGAPVTKSAQTRLIVLCVLTAVLWVGGTLFIVSRAYARIAEYRATVEEASAGQDIIFLSAANAPGLAHLTESSIERRLQDLLPVHERGPSVVGVFSIGNTTTAKGLVSERQSILEVLERAEANYISSFPYMPTPGSQNSGLTPRRSLQRSTPGHNSVSSRNSLSQSWARAQFPDAPESSIATDARGSAFLEVTQRRSVTFQHGRFSVGQRVVQDHDGTFVPAPGTVEDDTGDADTFETYPAQGSQDALDTRHQTFEADALSVPTSSLPPLELARLRGDVVWSRIRITKLTTQIGAAQRQAMSSLARGEGAIGWIIVGRGLKSIPYAEVIEGRAKEDIQWANLGQSRSERGFWYKTTAVSLGVAFLLIPFSSLSLAAAPGFADYLGFLGGLSHRNDIGAGLAQTLAPALVVLIFFGVAMGVINRLAVELQLASYNRQTALALKGSVYLISIVGGLWLIVSNTFKYPLQAYAAHSGVGRSLADGLVFSACLPLVVLILLVSFPAFLLLQPIRLVRHFVGSRAAETPRERFRLNYPADFGPTITLAPVIAAIIFAQTLAGLFPLLVIPALVVAYLALVVHHQLATKVYCLTRGGVSDGTIALWLIRRLGWTVVFPPLLFGLVVLSRKEWGIGAASIGVACIALVASEYLTIGRHPSPKSTMVSSPDFGPQNTYTAVPRHQRQSSAKASTLAPGSSLTAGEQGNSRGLLPGLSRLAWDNPLPFPTEAIDDMVSTERAARATPDLDMGQVDAAHHVSVIVSPDDSSRGLLYPPELLVGSPDVWLPSDEHGVAEREVESLAAAGLVAIIDPVDAGPARPRTLSYRPLHDPPPGEDDDIDDDEPVAKVEKPGDPGRLSPKG